MERNQERPAAVLKKLFTEPSVYTNPVKEKDYNQGRKPTTGKSTANKTGAAFNIDQYVKESFGKKDVETSVTPKTEYNNSARKTEDTQMELRVSQKRLQEAIIWSEILGKPACKRHRRWNR